MEAKILTKLLEKILEKVTQKHQKSTQHYWKGFLPGMQSRLNMQTNQCYLSATGWKRKHLNGGREGIFMLTTLRRKKILTVSVQKENSIWWKLFLKNLKFTSESERNPKFSHLKPVQDRMPLHSISFQHSTKLLTRAITQDKASKDKSRNSVKL